MINVLASKIVTERPAARSIRGFRSSYHLDCCAGYSGEQFTLMVLSRQESGLRCSGYLHSSVFPRLAIRVVGN